MSTNNGMDERDLAKIDRDGRQARDSERFRRILAQDEATKNPHEAEHNLALRRASEEIRQQAAGAQVVEQKAGVLQEGEKAGSFVGTDISINPAARSTVNIAMAIQGAIARQTRDAQAKLGGPVRIQSISHSMTDGPIAGAWTFVLILVAEPEKPS